jgi:hypothetical protein
MIPPAQCDNQHHGILKSSHQGDISVDEMGRWSSTVCAPPGDCSSHGYSDLSLPPRCPRSVDSPVRGYDGVQYETARHWGATRHGRPQEFPRWVPLMLEMMDPSVSTEAAQ